jgi:broad specificity phosphatase PhoE
MSVLVLVRHAQASFFSDNYDTLSPTGEAQARQLGDYWLRQGESFDEVYVGPRWRQQQTAALVAAQFRAAGQRWPDSVILEELDEYDLHGLLGRLSPALARQDRAFAALVATHQQSDGEQSRAQTFQRMFEALLIHWLAAPEAGERSDVESWPAFRSRVRRGLARMTDQPGRGRRVVAFTSGGFIGTAVGLILGVPDRSCLELNWRLRNTSLTPLLFTPGRLTLDAFNTLPHQPDPVGWTYR